MSSVFELHKPQEAHDYLNSFDAVTRLRGEDYFRNGRVGQLICEKAGMAYRAAVQGDFQYEVRIYYDNNGWTGECSCPMEFRCKHLFSAMKALLAEQNIAQVRALSEGKASKDGSSATPSFGQPSLQTDALAFAQRVAVALGHHLRPSEVAFLRNLTQVYLKCCQTHNITGCDLAELGLAANRYDWQSLNIWPAFPKDQFTFWLYIAYYAKEHNIPIPEFMAPVTDFSAIQDQLAAWWRGREIERWKRILAKHPQERPIDAPTSQVEFDLRVKVIEKKAVLEWKQPGQENFQPMNSRQLRQLEDSLVSGWAMLGPEAALIWQFFDSQLDFSQSAKLICDDPKSMDILGRLFRLPILESRIVNPEGQPFTRSKEPLHWELVPAETAQQDYHIRLARSDGTPMPQPLLAIDGCPSLIVTHDTVFAGPRLHTEFIDATRDNLIPAPALESRGGLEFIQTLRIDLPARIRDRVRHVPMSVAISCELRPIYPGSKKENCIVCVFAESADGQVQESWNGRAWINTTADTRRHKSNAEDQAIVLYGRDALAEIPHLLAPLELKPHNYKCELSIRVNKEFPEKFAGWLRSLPPHIKVELNGDLASLAQDAVSGRIRLDVTEAAIDWFDLSVVLDVSVTELTPEELKLLLNAKGRYVRLAKKGWRRLSINLTEEDDEQLARLGLNPHELTSEPQRLHALQLSDEAARKFLPEQQAAQIQRRTSEIKARVTPPLPAGLLAELRPYQSDGFHFLAYLATSRFGGILADDMGLGKTVQALTWLLWLRAQPDNSTRPVLVVCPKSVMDVWRAEAERFTPGLRVKMWTAIEVGLLIDRLGEADVHVLNYSQLRLAGEGLVPISWLAVILDEGQYIKNPNSLTAQVARALRADHRLVLSGTPIENRLLDLWSLMTFAMPGILSSRAHFSRMFGAKDDPFARRRLAARVRPFLMRRTKSQVAKDLPDRIEEDLFCEIEGEQKTLYQAELKLAQELLLRVKTAKELANEQFNFLVALLRLRQICCHPALVNPASHAESAKVNALREQLEPLMDEGHKVLVFSQFVEMLALLKPVLTRRGWQFFYLAGETENRGELVHSFQSAEGAAVFLISLKAGGFGLNLTAASYVVLFDPWWNPAVENQAIDRTHRIGQTNKVIAYRLLIKDSVEEKIRILQRRKSALAEDVLGEEKFAQCLTLEDLQFLFAD
jgi:hypothetical protein